MKTIAQPEWQESLSENALSRLSYNNQRIAQGSDQVLVNPAYTGISDDEMASQIQDILSKHELTPILTEIEESNRSKIGPRSIAKAWVDRKDSLYDYFAHNDFDPGHLSSTSVGSLRPSTVDTVSDNLLKSSSAGLPYMIRKGLVIDDAKRELAGQVGVYPCVLYTRTQEGGKTRNVWGYPISDTIWEQQFYMPWLSVERRLPWRSALSGPNAVDLAVSAMFAKKRPDDWFVGVDFSSYDASIKPEYSYNAFSQISSHFQRQYAAEIYRLYRRFVTIPINTPDGDIIGPHGVPSGSSFTNAVDSLVQYEVLRGEFDCQVQGDDGLYVMPEGSRDSALARFKANDFNVNESKSMSSKDDALFLQRYYNRAYPNKYGSGLGGVYSAFRAFNRIKYLEKWTNLEQEAIKGSDFFTLRTIMILENCKHHPAFRDLVKLAQNFDRTSLSYSESGLVSFSKMMASKARAGVFNQYGQQLGFRGFETVKLLTENS